ncbi:hypothetical protein HZY97_16090 [Sphingomonas sp. R-74633]|uniref:hypothetical protein n=1 Tax=Sphingomonas sp. R-74633 TaxID=2751188 RepID=UPI0015D3219F|nr:hypothetical protein [Sphingomonas sp. R-74633]NYT42293.1 hypothetical protein [Sphingomonas sp. R-74633]
MPHPPIIVHHASGRPVLVGPNNAFRFLHLDERFALWLGLTNAAALAERPIAHLRRASVAEPLGIASGNASTPSAASVEAIGGQPASTSMHSPELDHIEQIIDGAAADQVAAIAYAAIVRIGQLGPGAGEALGAHVAAHAHGPAHGAFERGICFIEPHLAAELPF